MIGKVLQKHASSDALAPLESSLPLSGFPIDKTIKTCSYGRKVFYGYAMHDGKHDGMLKLGDTTVSDHEIKQCMTSEDYIALAEKAARKRIGQQMGATASEYELVISEIIWHDPNSNFRDHKIHRILEHNGIERVNFSHSNAREWFYATKEQVVAALETYNKGFVNMSNANAVRKIIFREEQNRFAHNALIAWKEGALQRLWDAKMRFGKTVTALEFIRLASLTKVKGRRMRNVIIATNRPDVLDSWREDYETVLKHFGWQFSSRDKKDTQWEYIDKSRPYIRFVSLQDLKGQDGNGFKKTNDGIFATDWDLVIIDEAHEGNSTELADMVHANLKRAFTLYLSGTPFKYLASNFFAPEEIETWDYIDEQMAKHNWVGLDNPYEMLPQLNIYALDIRDSLRSSFSDYADGDMAFDLGEMWRMKSKTEFTHNEDVLGFIERLKGDGEAFSKKRAMTQPHMPYSKTFRETLLHALIVMPPSIAACKAFAKLLEADEFFKDYKIVIAAGNDTSEAKNALQSVKAAIKKYDKTITLTVGKLTTGVTVPEWSGVLMLSNTTSPSLYMQTIFRVQSPHMKEDGSYKTDAFVWDFATDRALHIISEVAGISSKAGSNNSTSRELQFTNMLNFMPIISHTSAGDFKMFDASDVTRELKRVYKERVVNSGFDSDLLLVRDSGIFTEEFREAVEMVRLSSGKSTPSTKNKADQSITIASNNFDNVTREEIDNDIAELEAKPELTQEQKDQLAAKKQELKERMNIFNVIKTVTARLPAMLIAHSGDKAYVDDLMKGNCSFSDLINSLDDESFKEFFGTVSRDMVLKLEPALDKHVLQVSVTGFMEELLGVYSIRESDAKSFLKGMETILGRIKNPNKETVFTPVGTAATACETADFTNSDSWRNVAAQRVNLADGGHGEKITTFYDINIKSGVFPMIEAVNLMLNSDGRSFAQICDESIFANARTLVSKHMTCAILGMPYNWANITVIDIITELHSEDIAHLSDVAKNLFVEHFLLSPLNTKYSNGKKKIASASDSTDRLNAIQILEKYDENIHKLVKDKDMNEEQKTAAKANLDSQVKKELNSSTVFDHSITNPPYQINLTETTSKAKPIWQHFLVIASEISNHVAIINPARWQKGGQGTGLGPIKEWLLSNPHFKKVVNMSGADVFPTASIAGNVSIEIIDNTKTFKNPKIGSWSKAEGFSELKDLIITDDIDIPLDDTDTEIVHKIIEAAVGDNFEKHLWVGGENNELNKITNNPTNRGGGNKRNYTISGQRMIHDTDYFVAEDEKIQGIEYVKIWYNEKTSNKISARYVPRSEFKDTERNNVNIPAWKVLIPKTGASVFYRNLGPLGEPETLSTNTWICRTFGTKNEANGFSSYLRTYFYRYLVSIRSVTHNAYANVHRFVPDLANVKNPRTGKMGYESDWIDDDLKIVFKGFLTEEDWKHIKATAVAADGGKGDYEAGWTFPDGKTHHSLTLKQDKE